MRHIAMTLAILVCATPVYAISSVSSGLIVNGQNKEKSFDDIWNEIWTKKRINNSKSNQGQNSLTVGSILNAQPQPQKNSGNRRALIVKGVWLRSQEEVPPPLPKSPDIPDNPSPSPVPEPASLGLMAAGLGSAWLWRRRQ